MLDNFKKLKIFTIVVLKIYSYWYHPCGFTLKYSFIRWHFITYDV